MIRGRRALTALTVAAVLSGCDSVGPPELIVLPITRLDAPATVAQGATLVTQLTVQSGGCDDFDRLHVTREAGQVTITAIGLDRSRPDALCTADIRVQSP